MKTLQMWAAGAALMSIVTLGAPMAAQASAEGSKNTAIALGAAAVYALVNHKPGAALVLGAGAAVAAKQSDDQRKNEDWRGRYHRDDNWSYSSSNRYNQDRTNHRDDDYDRSDNNYSYKNSDNRYRQDKQSGSDYNSKGQDNWNNRDGRNRDNGDYETRPNIYQSGGAGNGDFRRMGGANR